MEMSGENQLYDKRCVSGWRCENKKFTDFLFIIYGFSCSNVFLYCGALVDLSKMYKRRRGAFSAKKGNQKSISWIEINIQKQKSFFSCLRQQGLRTGSHNFKSRQEPGRNITIQLNDQNKSFIV